MSGSIAGIVVSANGAGNKSVFGGGASSVAASMYGRGICPPEGTAAQLLPPNATDYMRASAAALDARAPLADKAQYAKRIGADIYPKDWLAWLVVHYGLDPISPYIGDLRRTIVDGRHWQRIRGTPGATENFVFDWLDLAGRDVPDGYGGHGPVEEEYPFDVKWWLYQIALAEPLIDTDALTRLIGADRLSKNAGTALGRIYAGYDIRPMRLDGKRLDGAMLDDWSGVFLPNIDPKLSFGQVSGNAIESGISVYDSCVDTIYARMLRAENGFVLDMSRLDDEQVNPLSLTMDVSFLIHLSDFIFGGGGAWPLGPWPGYSWIEMPAPVYGGADQPVEE